MANTKITSRVIADNSVGIDALNVTDGTSGQAHVTDGSGGLSFASVGVSGIDSSADATAITIDSSENVGIGIGSPSARTHIYDAAIDAVLYMDSGNVNGSHARFLASGSVKHFVGSGGGFGLGDVDDFAIRSFDNILFSTGNSSTERMRIDSAGNLNIGTTGQLGGGWDAALNVSNNNNIAFFKSTGGGGSAGVGIQVGTYTATTSAAVFYNGSGGVAGSISLANANTSTSVSYNTSSDYRLKENVVTDWDATTRLKQLKPSRFNFIADADTTVDGFLAHEVQDIVPEAITGVKDAVDSEGNPEYQGIDQSKLVPLLTKAIQEQQTIIESLEARITALES